MSTNPTPAEITKARAIIEFTDARDAALASAANLIEVANDIQNNVARGHFNAAAHELGDAAEWLVNACKRAGEARDTLWEIQAAERRAAAVAEAAEQRAAAVAEAAEFKAARPARVAARVAARAAAVAAVAADTKADK